MPNQTTIGTVYSLKIINPNIIKSIVMQLISTFRTLFTNVNRWTLGQGYWNVTKWPWNENKYSSERCYYGLSRQRLHTTTYRSLIRERACNAFACKRRIYKQFVVLVFRVPDYGSQNGTLEKFIVSFYYGVCSVWIKLWMAK